MLPLLFCKKLLFCEPGTYENLNNQNKVLYFKRGTVCGESFLGLGIHWSSMWPDAGPAGL
jgi:hypothetical protein